MEGGVDGGVAAAGGGPSSSSGDRESWVSTAKASAAVEASSSSLPPAGAGDGEGDDSAGRLKETLWLNGLGLGEVVSSLASSAKLQSLRIPGGGIGEATG